MRNVVLLTVDALRADRCGWHGHDRETTPRLDAVASEGARFVNAYSSSSHTREAVPALLTGRHPGDAVGADYRLATPTVAARLADGPRRTAAFHSNPYVSRAYGFDDGFDAFDDDLRLGRHRLLALAQRAWDKLRGRHYARAPEINERALDWLDRRGDEPFLLWNHYMDVHGPYEPPAAEQRRFRDEPVPAARARRLYERALDDPDALDAAERETLVDLYDAEVRYLDRHVGDFLDALDDRGLLDDALVILTADHGDAFGEHGYYEHPRRLHEELVHVPLVVSDEGPAARVEPAASSVDVVPTVLAALGRDASDLPGVPLQRLRGDPGAYAGRAVVSEARSLDGDGRRYAVRTADRTRLFPDGVPDGGGALAAALREHAGDRTAGAPGTGSDGESEPTGAVADRLRALGYRE